MYKVFLNDRLIRIGAPENSLKNNLVVKFDEKATAENIKNWFSSFINEDLKDVFLATPQPELFFKLFRSTFLEYPAAGGVILSENRMLFIFRNGKWDLPKGKIEKGELPRDTALREVGEECGISGHQIERQLPSTFHIYQSPYPKTEGQWVVKETFWFEMQYGDGELVPQQEEGITEVRWFHRNELDEVLANTYENLKQVILFYRD
ncbi:ADP-ribose pyrophosphatase YjhB, NUDIX family [Mariniphaga anaerophila]|uniref:ADP-ribose pyrophosphatase YjhB, NUDIX family n=1 Tax=Mariniphaga anaerophila TaxID=1484053 RepID=A0A1M5E2B7_9BACT|nr:NUDIX domain-containing protein [Mariniphaga anaerophila]SHF73326.1 ADP-ribose pyrophosphatase YjhB, NUDIX family [Mariniphaga anaerophila]